METLLQWGIGLIVALQKIHEPALDNLFRLISFMGNQEFYLFLLPVLLWCVDFGLGARVAIIFLLSGCINTDLKDLFHMPRPFDLDPSVKLIHAGGYGLPSGHSQSAVVVWGAIAAWTRKTRFWVLAIGLVLSIGFSRVYLGVHFPTDVLAGWMIGVVLLTLYLAAQFRVGSRLTELSLCGQILLALAIPLVLLLIHPTKQTIAALAALAGIGVGLALTGRYVSFSTRGPWWQRVCRFLVGGAIISALYFGLKVIFPAEGSPLYLVFRFIRYFCIGMWGSFGGPWLFRWLKLAPAGEIDACLGTSKSAADGDHRGDQNTRDGVRSEALKN